MSLMKSKVDILSYMEIRSTFFVPDVQLLPHETYVFQSLSDNTWILILSLFVLMAMLIRLVSKYHEGKTIDNSFMISLSYLVVNSTTTHATTYLFKVVLLMWSITCLLFTTSYSAGFTSIENVPRTTKPIRTFKDMFESEATCYIFDDFLNAVMRASGDEYKIKLADKVRIASITSWAQQPVPSKCVSTDVIINRYIHSPYKISRDNMLDMKLLEENFQMTDIAIGITLRSPLFKPLQSEISKLLEHRLMEYLLRTTNNLDLSSVESFNRNRWSLSEYEAKAVNLAKIQGAFILLGTGICLACIVFVCELFIVKFWLSENRFT